jgi:hypothetical protein|tara:strand:+ start:129 stop:872 length:744 start_codon:yes stop_codon:yes gene_type:complete
MSKVAVIVETRRHKALPFVLNNVMSILPDEWELQIFHGSNNLNYLVEVVQSDVVLKNRDVYFNDLKIDSVSADDSSLEIMLTEDFWNQIIGETVLYFECDSMLCFNSEHKVEDFEHFNYIGGYWGNQLYDLDGKYPVVMNGGVSIRKKEFMLDIIKNELQPYLESGGNPCEDYFVTECVSHLDMPTTKEVLSFSIDNGYMAPLDMKPPFALHKPWGVNSAKGHGLFYNRIKEVCSGVEELERLNDGL